MTICSALMPLEVKANNMTRDEVRRMAIEAGGYVNNFGGRWTFFGGDLEKFAELVAAAEREACAKLCERRFMGDGNREDMEAKRCAADIRRIGE